MVNHPDHYISNRGIETIDVIEAFIQDIEDPFTAYCTGNIIKYMCRWPNKNGVEDLRKAQWYLDCLIEYIDDDMGKRQKLEVVDQYILNREPNIDHNEEA